MPGITHKVLVQQLRELEADGLIQRKAHRETVPRIEYSLTSYGETIRPITELMCNWGKAHQPEYRSSFMPLGSLCILVVKPLAEDDRLLESLEANGFWAIAVTPKVAIAKLDQLQPDVVIIDTNSVETERLALINQIKVVENAQNREILTIALTAPKFEDDFLQNVQLCLTKPVQPAEIVAAIANLTH